MPIAPLFIYILGLYYNIIWIRVVQDIPNSILKLKKNNGVLIINISRLFVVLRFLPNDKSGHVLN